MTNVMEGLLKADALKCLRANKIVSGTISEIRPDEVAIDIGAKAEGIVPASEFDNLDELSVGETVEVYVERVENIDGRPVLSYNRAQQQKNWATILEKCTEGGEISGRVKGKTKGGLIVNIGVDAFLPSSQIDTQAPRDLDQYIGQTFDLKIVKINRERHNIVVSRRELIETQRQQKRQEVLDTVKVGSVVRGVVKNVTDYGVFVDLDGLDGLVHVTDISWKRVSHPGDVLKVGEEVEVVVTEIDREKERVSLSMKKLHGNPWDGIENKYPVGSKVHGKVTNLTQYGAFVELEEGVEGLVHLTEFSWIKHITKPGEVLKVGDEIDVVVLEVKKDEQRISLGIKQLTDNPWDMATQNYPVGARVHGQVRNLTNYGAFIGLEEGIDGMVHVSDMSWTRKINHPSELLKKGDEVDAVVLECDPSAQRISLGMKQLTDDPWAVVDTMYKIGDIVKGKVTKVASFGLFVELENGIEALVHISQVSEERVEKLQNHFKAGDTVEARIVKIDKAERRLGLSIKAAKYDEARLAEEVKQYETISADRELNNAIGEAFARAERESSNQEP